MVPFHQGEAVEPDGTPAPSCIPTITGDTIPTGLCFQKLCDGEFLKGREYQTRVRASAGGTLLQETLQAFSVSFLGYGSTPLAGLWRAFTAETETESKQYEGGGAPLTQRTLNTYDLTYNTNRSSIQPPPTYGNLSQVEEFDSNDTLFRRTVHWYVTNDAAYIVDRARQNTVYDGSGNLLSVTNQFYDQTATADAEPTIGELRRSSAYFDIPPGVSSTSLVHGTDTTYTYDPYGNQAEVRVYTGTHARSYDGTTVTWDPPGGSAQLTTTSYDRTFHVFPTQTTNALGQSESAGYNGRMGTLTSITDANGATTLADYDKFGRLIAIAKPGDTLSVPTIQAFYDDSGPIFRYVLHQREISGNSQAYRGTRRFYDGMGRLIQVKSESVDDAQNSVTNTRYDGMGRTIQESQAHYVNEAPPNFWNYTPPGSAEVERWTTTTYDPLGRVLTVTTPDGRTTTTQRSRGSIGQIITSIDANGHTTDRESDVFGRVRQIVEYGATPGGGNATTQYTYDTSDRLTAVLDAHGNTSQLVYDTLGRKLSMNDPDLGQWLYAYDANGNLTRQTDARGQRVCLYYDDLNRLYGKHYRADDACPASFPNGAADISYAYDQGTNGIGRRASMSANGASTAWLYDSRGRMTQATNSVPGLAGTRVFSWAYDSADRIQTLTYPQVGANAREQLTYGYDAAWHPISVCSSLGVCYANASQPYTALNQPKQWTFGNGIAQTWNYDNPADLMQRLQNIHVGPSTTSASLMNMQYSYDPVSNITAIRDTVNSQTQNFLYDARDRLTHAWTTVGAGGRATNTPLAAAAQIAQARQPDLASQAVARDEPALPGRAGLALTPVAAATPPLPSPRERGLGGEGIAATEPITTPTARRLGQLPLAFTANAGQHDATAHYHTTGSGGSIFFQPQGVVFALPTGPRPGRDHRIRPGAEITATRAISTSLIRMNYLGTGAAGVLTATMPLSGTQNYFIGNDSSKWRTNLPTYAGIVYQQLYPGIDVQYDGTDGQLKSTYTITPGANLNRLRWRYQGARCAGRRERRPPDSVQWPRPTAWRDHDLYADRSSADRVAGHRRRARAG